MGCKRKMCRYYGDTCKPTRQWAAVNYGAPFKPLRQSEIIERPIGNDDFIRDAEKQTGRSLKAKRRGPKPKTD